MILPGFPNMKSEDITVKKSTNNVIIGIIKSVIYIGIGFGGGMVISSNMAELNKWIVCLSLVCLAVITALITNVLLYEPTTMTRTISGQNSQAISEKNSFSQQNSSRISSRQVESLNAKVTQENALDRRPLSAERKNQYEQNRKPSSKIVLLNEEGSPLLQWSLQNKTSLIIGKSTDKAPVDIDLSTSAMAYMISKQHAVLNYTENGWYIDDIDSKNGTRVKKRSQNAIMDIKLVGAVEVEPGDIIYLANAMMQIQ